MLLQVPEIVCDAARPAVIGLGPTFTESLKDCAMMSAGLADHLRIGQYQTDCLYVFPTPQDMQVTRKGMQNFRKIKSIVIRPEPTKWIRLGHTKGLEEFGDQCEGVRFRGGAFSLIASSTRQERFDGRLEDRLNGLIEFVWAKNYSMPSMMRLLNQVDFFQDLPEQTRLSTVKRLVMLGLEGQGEAAKSLKQQIILSVISFRLLDGGQIVQGIRSKHVKFVTCHAWKLGLKREAAQLCSHQETMSILSRPALTSIIETAKSDPATGTEWYLDWLTPLQKNLRARILGKLVQIIEAYGEDLLDLTKRHYIIVRICRLTEALAGLDFEVWEDLVDFGRLLASVRKLAIDDAEDELIYSPFVILMKVLRANLPLAIFSDVAKPAWTGSVVGDRSFQDLFFASHPLQPAFSSLHVPPQVTDEIDWLIESMPSKSEFLPVLEVHLFLAKTMLKYDRHRHASFRVIITGFLRRIYDSLDQRQVLLDLASDGFHRLFALFIHEAQTIEGGMEDLLEDAFDKSLECFCILLVHLSPSTARLAEIRKNQPAASVLLDVYESPTILDNTTCVLDWWPPASLMSRTGFFILTADKMKVHQCDKIAQASLQLFLLKHLSIPLDANRFGDSGESLSPWDDFEAILNFFLQRALVDPFRMFSKVTIVAALVAITVFGFAIKTYMSSVKNFAPGGSSETEPKNPTYQDTSIFQLFRTDGNDIHEPLSITKDGSVDGNSSSQFFRDDAGRLYVAFEPCRTYFTLKDLKLTYGNKSSDENVKLVLEPSEDSSKYYIKFVFTDETKDVQYLKNYGDSNEPATTDNKSHAQLFTLQHSQVPKATAMGCFHFELKIDGIFIKPCMISNQLINEDTWIFKDGYVFPASDESSILTSQKVDGQDNTYLLSLSNIKELSISERESQKFSVNSGSTSSAIYQENGISNESLWKLGLSPNKEPRVTASQNLGSGFIITLKAVPYETLDRLNSL